MSRTVSGSRASHGMSTVQAVHGSRGAAERGAGVLTLELPAWCSPAPRPGAAVKVPRVAGGPVWTVSRRLLPEFPE